MSKEKSPTHLSGQLDLMGITKENEYSQENTKESAAEVSINKLASRTKSNEEEIACPDTLLIVDTETTGLDKKKDFCMEVGAILFHVQTRSVLAQQSFLLPVENNNAEKINRIPALITRLPQPVKEGIQYFNALVACADAIVAHNASFDVQWFGRALLPKITKPWICSMEDISWPLDKQLSRRPSVRDLALAYGVPVWTAHRALTDCIYLSEVFVRCEKLEDLLLNGLEPRRLMRADVSYDQRHLAKEAGFRWNEPIAGAWTRRLSEKEASRLTFPVVEVHLG